VEFLASSPAEPETTEQFVLRLPDAAKAGADQDEEWCEVVWRGRRRHIRFHDYEAVYSIPGLYEELIYSRLRCESPRVIARMLAAELDRRGQHPRELRVLDLGAGNGIVGRELAGLGVNHLVGVDILEAAATAAERDHPGLYDDYLVGDLGDPGDTAAERLGAHSLNALTCVAALGFGDIPPTVFAEALTRVDAPGLVAFTIKDRFLEESDPSGFEKLVRRLVESGELVVLASERYRHRLSWAGEPLHYVAMLAEKPAET
jgi:predicted TPR repeat methyltransferase